MYADMSQSELQALKAKLEKEYHKICAKGLKLNMARGKPGTDQLALSKDMLEIIDCNTPLISEDGINCANYGGLEGIKEARQLMASIMEHDPADVFVFGNSSLNIMYDLMVHGELYGYEGQPAWKTLPQVKWICPAPGYDRHFRIAEKLGFELIAVPMREDGPDMDQVEALVADPAVKGIWCVPQYSNPTGYTYSEKTVWRLASMNCAAPDFRIFWDNAYCVHHLYDAPEKRDHVPDIAAACNAAKNPNRYFKFASTSKVTLPGDGIAAVAASPDNMKLIRERVGTQTVGYDKINQLRHVLFLESIGGVDVLMRKHAAIIRPKFEVVLAALERELGDTGATWTRPRGGYFISFNGAAGTARRTVQLAKDAGVVLTDAGATWPYGDDPMDSNIRIAPTLPPIDELKKAMEVFCCCAKLATVESLLA